MNLPILMYHSISNSSDPRFRRWVVTQSDLQAQLSAVLEAGYSPVSMSDIAVARAGGSPLPSRPVAITFDDGFADFRTGAMPVLRELGCRSTLFVTTAYLNGTSLWLEPEGEAGRPMLKAADVRWLAENQVEIGGHGHSHAMLDLLPPDVMRQEIETSKTILERLLGTEICSFAYPHGHADRAVHRATFEAGFRLACGVSHSIATGNSNPYHLPRLIVDAATPPRRLLAWLDGGVAVRSDRYLRSRAAVGRLSRRRERDRHMQLAREASGMWPTETSLGRERHDSA